MLISNTYQVFSFNKVIQELNRSTYSQLSAFYFQSIKERLYVDGKLSLARRSAQTAVYRDGRWHNTALEQDWTVLRHLCSQYYQLVEKVRQAKGSQDKRANRSDIRTRRQCDISTRPITTEIRHYEWCIWPNDSTLIGTT
ncbi:hypothetical protein BDF22DRAFT_733030 [Syncephalis plumigaleata]|nr:hypothetical protein BDF22DRAFT_733030 [Syncephalis plumigaleata]